MVKLRRGLGNLTAWAALFIVAGIAYAARRRAGAPLQPDALDAADD